MNRPALTIQVQKVNGRDVYGQPSFTAPVSELVCPVKLRFRAQHTSVRTDSTATHGHAFERDDEVVILAMPNTRLSFDDRVTILGNTLRVVALHPRFTVSGVLDHYRVELMTWV